MTLLKTPRTFSCFFWDLFRQKVLDTSFSTLVTYLIRSDVRTS